MTEINYPILSHFELHEEASKHFSEEEVMALLTARIAWMMEHKMELLFSLLYRLDIDEEQVRRIIHPESDIPAAEGLAHLVFKRQKARQHTKKDIRVEEIDPDLAW